MSPRLFSPLKFHPLVISALLVWSGMAGAAEKPAPKKTVMGGSLTLEDAYDRALATDQTIGIAYWKSASQPAAVECAGQDRPADQCECQLQSPRQCHATFGHRVRHGRGEWGVHAAHSRNVDITTTPAAGPPRPAYLLAAHHRFYGLPGLPCGDSVESSHATRASVYDSRDLFGLAGAFYDVLKQQRLVEVDRETLRLTTSNSISRKARQRG